MGLGLPAALGEADQLGAAVGGVGDALGVAAGDEVVDDLAGGLLGQARQLGEAGEPHALALDEAEDAAVGGADVGELRLLQLGPELGQQRLEGDVEQPREGDPGGLSGAGVISSGSLIRSPSQGT